jgi:hypothetical protein
MNYTFEGKHYKIKITDESPRNEERSQQIYDDFKYCESQSDWVTIKNRIIGGVKWGWMVEVDETDNKQFW